MRPPLVLLHGFAQTGRCWGALPEDLIELADVVAVDLPGHGLSRHSPASVGQTAELLAAEHPGPGIWLGYSFGARVALRLALDHPAACSALVLVSGTAGLEDRAERAARVSADEALADRLEAEGVSAFLDRWLALPLFAGLTPATDYRAERETNTAAGLANSLRLAGTGAMEPMWDRLDELRQRQLPVLIVAGVRDPKFVAAGRRLGSAIGGSAAVAVIDGAGHTVHLEAPEAFVVVLKRWLAAL